MNKKRFKNYGLWASIFAFIPLLLDGLKIYDINVVLPDNYELIVKSFLGILVLAGILNNPMTKNKGFKDDTLKDSDVVIIDELLKGEEFK